MYELNIWYFPSIKFYTNNFKPILKQIDEPQSFFYKGSFKLLWMISH